MDKPKHSDTAGGISILTAKAVVTQPERVKRSKYGAIPTVVDNVRFASKREAARYSELKMLERSGNIAGLVWDKKKLRWPLEVNGIKICVYEADFAYYASSSRNLLINSGYIIGVDGVGDVTYVIEDCKGFKTPAYKLKKKLMKAIHGIEIREV